MASDDKILARMLIVLHYLVARGTVSSEEEKKFKAYLGRIARQHKYAASVYGAALTEGVVYAAKYGITVIPIGYMLHEEYKKQVDLYTDKTGKVRIEGIISE